MFTSILATRNTNTSIEIFANRGEQARAQAAAAAEAAAAQQAAMAAVEAEAKQETIAEPSGSSIDFSDYTHRVVSFLARNFYNLKYVALVLAFCINFMLLFYKVNATL